MLAEAVDTHVSGRVWSDCLINIGQVLLLWKVL